MQKSPAAKRTQVVDSFVKHLEHLLSARRWDTELAKSGLPGSRLSRDAEGAPCTPARGSENDEKQEGAAQSRWEGAAEHRNRASSQALPCAPWLIPQLPAQRL